MKTGNLYSVKSGKIALESSLGIIKTSWIGDFFLATSEEEAKEKALEYLEMYYGWSGIIETETEFEVEIIRKGIYF